MNDASEQGGNRLAEEDSSPGRALGRAPANCFTYCAWTPPTRRCPGSTGATILEGVRNEWRDTFRRVAD